MQFDRRSNAHSPTTWRVVNAGRVGLCAIAAAGLICVVAYARDGDAPGPRGDDRRIVLIDADNGGGLPSGGCVVEDRVPEDMLRLILPASYVTVVNNGPNSNRANFVYVGDGYQAHELGAYNQHVLASINHMFAEEPFKTYQTLVNVHRVDVISVDSGVTNDPVQGVNKNTAMQMRFWCNGTERLLCVNTSLANGFANNAPAVHQIFAVANSSKYGGAGYFSPPIGTYAGANAASNEIALHEIGHSFGKLADEYDYGGPVTYTGGERPEPNVSIRNATQMAALNTKWAAWLGVNNPLFDGLINTYEGAYYSQFGVYRPTNNSKMRSLNRPFNLPSIEAMIVEVYKRVDPIDAATPELAPLLPGAVVQVTPVQPVNHSLDIHWELNGQPIPEYDGQASLPLGAIALPFGSSLLTVKVVDNTPFVRNEAARANFMTGARVWMVVRLAGDVNHDGVVDFADFSAVLAQYGLSGPDLIGDANGDGVVDFADFSLVLNNYGASAF